MTVVTALITPFRGEEVDYAGLETNIEFQIKNGVSGIFPLGSTGESPTITEEEEEKIIATCVDVADGRVAVWAGTGNYSTKETIEKTKKAKQLGADVACIVVPYYNRPSQEGIFRHFEAIAHAVDIPIVLYNNPSRCVVNVEPTTLARIAELPNVIGIKESTGNLVQASEMMRLIPGFLFYSGDDVYTLPLMAVGFHGVVSVASNLIPDKMVRLSNLCAQGDFAKARSIHLELLPFFRALFIEPNPIPIKAAMELCGMAAGKCRLPLTELSATGKEILLKSGSGILCEELV